MQNTLEAALKEWKEREQRYEKLFSPSVLKSREFIKEKLRHFDELRARVQAGSLIEDRLAIRALLVEKKQLARQAYPNIIIRLLYSAISGFRIGRNIERIRQQSRNNIENVRAAMTKVGLESFNGLLELQMKKGSMEFSLPVSYHVNEHERMDLQLQFKRNGDGNYLFDSYKATLYNDLEKGKPKQRTFSVGNGNILDTIQAHNLLSGRAIYNANDKSWHQLDFNDKDASGNIRIRQFPAGYGFDIEKSLAQLPLKGNRFQELTDSLKSGHRVEVTINSAGKDYMCFIEADPKRKELSILDSTTGQKINPEKIGGKNESQVRVREMKTVYRNKHESLKGKALKN